jgi:osmotically-inducible protein OsmY
MCSYSPLSKDVETKLPADHLLHPWNVSVTASNGITIPAGGDRAHDTTPNVRAEATAISKSGSDTRGADGLSDAYLVQSALSALKRNALVPLEKIRPIARDGWLILEGAVEAPHQKRAAADTIRRLNGIRGFSNNIVIESDLIARRVSQHIAEEFTLNALLSAHRILITVHDHRVVLSGSARSVAEREEAEVAAWRVPGVAAVVNRIRVAPV